MHVVLLWSCGNDHGKCFALEAITNNIKINTYYCWLEKLIINWSKLKTLQIKREKKNILKTNNNKMNHFYAITLLTLIIVCVQD